MGASFRLLREEDLSLEQVLLALPWVVPFLLPYLIPMALVTTLALVYGRMVADNEVLAFGSLGIPGRSLAHPAILLGGLLSLGMFWFTAEVVPYCHQQKSEAGRAVFRQLFSLGQGEHWSRSFPSQGFDLYVRRYEPGQLTGIVIHYDAPAGGVRSVPTQVTARRGKIGSESGTERLVLQLDDVVATIQPSQETDDTNTARSKREEPIRVHLRRYAQGISLGGRRRIKPTDLGSFDLRDQVAQMELRSALAGAVGGLTGTFQGMDGRGPDAEVELMMRPSMALAPLLVALLVIPVTLVLKARSPLVPFAAGLLTISGCFFAPLLLGRSLAEANGQPLWVGLGVLVALVASGLLAAFAARR